jgi:dienelactone hydrolase
MNSHHTYRKSICLRIALVALAASTAGVNAQSLSGTMKKAKKTDFSDRTVTFEAADGVRIEADWYPARVKEGEKAPVAILIHMYPATRSSWKPLVPLLRNELGISVLAYDIRGTGGSTKPEELELQKKYESRDQAHFLAATRDTAAADEWLAMQPNVDVKRMILIGASVGCSISLQYASERGDIVGVACLSPGTDYMGIDSINHIKILKDTKTKILLMSPEGEYGAVESLIKAAGESGHVKGKKYGGGRENHGTGMFEAKYGSKVKKRLQTFARGVLDLNSDKPEKEKTSKKKEPRAG